MLLPQARFAMLPVASRQWSTSTFEEGLACVAFSDPATLVAPDAPATSDMGTLDDAALLEDTSNSQG